MPTLNSGAAPGCKHGMCDGRLTRTDGQTEIAFRNPFGEPDADDARPVPTENTEKVTSSIFHIRHVQSN